jgi:hypothetical protein
VTGHLAAWLVGVAILAMSCAGCVSAQSAALPPRCFRATGHTVSGRFLSTFSAAGGQRSLGYPITEPFEQEGRRVQYFEYARLEDHPDDPGGAVVKLSLLGERLGRRRPPLATRRVPSTYDASSRYYPQTGHNVSGDFLTFFDANGGLERFGFPIAEPVVADGNLVQDFQRARLIWHASTLTGDRVAMEPLGRIYFEVQGLDEALLNPVVCTPEAQVVEP